MEKRDEIVLVSDILARIPYGVRVCCPYMYGDRDLGILYANEREVKFADTGAIAPIQSVKPFLRKPSSITDEEMEQAAYRVFGGLVKKGSDGVWRSVTHDQSIGEVEQDLDLGYLFGCNYGTDGLDWLNEHHFDYRDLIGKGLAVEAPLGMYTDLERELLACAKMVSESEPMVEKGVSLKVTPMERGSVGVVVSHEGDAVLTLLVTKGMSGLYDSVFFKAHEIKGVDEDECYKFTQNIILDIVKSLLGFTDCKLFEQNIIVSGLFYPKNEKLTL